jgi:hypothetical protein
MTMTATSIGSVTLPKRPVRRAWALLIAGPLIFLAAIIVASVYFGVVTRGDAQAIAERTPQAMPAMLVVVLLAGGGLSGQ